MGCDRVTRPAGSRSFRVLGVLVVLLGLLTPVTGCGSAPDRSPEPGSGTVTVLAAASLTEVFTEIGKRFEEAHHGSRIRFSFASSATLAQQITEGAPADVFAAANPATMQRITGAGLTSAAPVVFTRNRLVIAVAKGNPKRITGLGDLTRPGVTVARCADQAPCGAAAKTALEAAGVALTPATLEQDVRATLTKLRLGEVDAALVYRTDVQAAERDVDGVEFPESAHAINDSPIAALRQGPNPPGASAFVAFVRSDSARQVLTDAGFEQP